MEPDQSNDASTLAGRLEEALPGASVRYSNTTVQPSDAAGAAALEDPRLHEQLEIIKGRRLSQFSMASSGIRLALWGEHAGNVGREILIEHATLDLAQAGEEARVRNWNDDVVATSLLSALDRKVTRIDLTDGYLSIDFDNDLRLRVEPDEHYESWEINSDDNLLIVCTPGGSLTVWYPDTPS
jgi:Family of unknown function (DUF6188)